MAEHRRRPVGDQTPEGHALNTMRVVELSCRVCHQPFAYQYVGAWRDDLLLPIDHVCRACFPAWYHGWAHAHGWG